MFQFFNIPFLHVSNYKRTAHNPRYGLTYVLGAHKIYNSLSLSLSENIRAVKITVQFYKLNDFQQVMKHLRRRTREF